MRHSLLALLIAFLIACGERVEEQSTGSTLHDSALTDTIPVAESQIKPHPVFSDTSIFPSGYVIIDSAYGNLNLDSYTDAVLVFAHNSETEGATYSERPRALLIFLGDSLNRLDLALRNDQIVYTEAEGQMFGESFAGIEIDSGLLRVNHYGGSRFRWTADYVFEYDAGKKSWFYTRSFASMGDMLGEMNDLTETGQCIPYANDTLIVKKPIDIRKFDNRTAPVAATSE
jgi:hypothetical protein